MNKIAKNAKSFLYLGQCIPSTKKNAAKIQVRTLEMDTYLTMVRKNNYFTFLKQLTIAFIVFQERSHILRP